MIHVQSVIATAIADYSEDLYLALTHKEYKCYTQSQRPPLVLESEMIAAYSPFFTALSNAILINLAVAPAKASLESLMGSIYAFTILNSQFKDFDDKIPLIQAAAVFNCSGLRDEIINEQDEFYYDSYTPALYDEFNVLISEASAATIQAHTEAFLADNGDAISALADALAEELNACTYYYVQRLMYMDAVTPEQVAAPGFVPPAPHYLTQTGTSPAKSEMYNQVFVQYGYDIYLPMFGLSSVDPFA